MKTYEFVTLDVFTDTRGLTEADVVTSAHWPMMALVGNSLSSQK